MLQYLDDVALVVSGTCTEVVQDTLSSELEAIRDYAFRFQTETP